MLTKLLSTDTYWAFDCGVTASMEGSDLCQEIVKRASSGFVYSEAVARYDSSLLSL